MKYILQNCFNNELQARQEYLYLALKRYFVVTNKNDMCTVLESFPFFEDNILMLYGHNYWIFKIFKLAKKELTHFTKVVNSCSLHNKYYVLLGQKNLFYNKLDCFGNSICYDGKAFGLNFDVTESELNFLNATNLSLLKRIEFAYRKVA